MKMRKLILSQGQSPGDILTMTRAVGDLKRTYPEFEIDVRTPCPEIWENNPHLTKISDSDPEAEKYSITYDEINQSGVTGQHFSDAFLHDIEKKVGAPIIKTGIDPELYISEAEQGWINQVETEFGWTGPFWLINAGAKQDNELKQYHRYQEFVNLFNDYFKGSVRLVQIGHNHHGHTPLTRVYNLLGKTDLRQLIRLGWWAHGSIGPISFQFVMSAAYRQPHVVVAAGKEGVRWHIYPSGKYLYSNGALKCCEYDGCWLGGVKGLCRDLFHGVPRCFALIEPRMILDAVLGYYQGGRLGLDRGR
jgi:ADP-heptose:LPS heptosyltransferase